MMMIVMTKTMMIVAEVVMVMIIENFDRQEVQFVAYLFYHQLYNKLTLKESLSSPFSPQ